jgi:hypothetical protein
MVQGLPHDIYLVQPYVRPLWLTVVIILGVLAVIVLLFGFLYQWYRKRQSYLPPERIRDSWELLSDELQLLHQKIEAQEPEMVRELFYGLSLVLRRGIELASGVRATDLTVQELKARLKTQSGIPASLVKDLVTFLSRADMIKFADVLAEAGEAPQSYNAVKDWIAVLKPKPQAPLPYESLKVQDTKGILR